MSEAVVNGAPQTTDSAETTTFEGDVHVKGGLTVDGGIRITTGVGVTWTIYTNPDGSLVISDSVQGVLIRPEGTNGNPPMQLLVAGAPVETGS